MKKTPLALLLTLGLLQTPLAAFAATAPLDLVGPVSDYKIYVTENIEELVSHTQKFTDAVKKGDIATAKKLYAPTRVYYESVEPIAELFSDLDASIDSRVDDHEQGVTAEDFTGFHRLEYALFSQNTTKDQGPIADKLLSDVKDLEKRVADQGFAVVLFDFVVGFKATVLGFVLGEDFVHGGEVLVDFAGEGLVLLFDLRAEQVDDFFRAVDVALEVIQVGVAVTVFFAGDLGRCHFFQQGCGAA
ncbi:imelysin family protein, partial [Pseudomonas syringae]|uniref:imelysin family protein n=1 Tax=Pseudomonas syringae TaxID=317 RepID=UPI003D800440